MERTTPGPNRSWPRETTPSDKEAPNPLALTGPRGISVSPRLADRLLMARRYRAPRADSGQEQSDQDSEDVLPHYSITWSARCKGDAGMVRPRALAVSRLQRVLPRAASIRRWEAASRAAVIPAWPGRLKSRVAAGRAARGLNGHIRRRRYDLDVRPCAGPRGATRCHHPT